jgi:hypothetical protein
LLKKREALLVVGGRLVGEIFATTSHYCAGLGGAPLDIKMGKV